ncbi:hypothetical protein DH2020_007862 [Rehmannia glutinosa]|uniref:Auxilin-related protein n=1 Tax=Rehmannia glutinosa TaxID=99300 RepID=A0ABR0TZC6_REHGL
MDEFGVLVESIGFRAHGKSAPMAKLKPKPKSHFTPHSTVHASSLDNSYSLPVDELDGIFRSNGQSQIRDPVDDLFGNFGLNFSGNQEKKAPGFDDLIPGFGGASPSKNRVSSETKSNGRPANSSSIMVDDPFLFFESSISQSDASWPFAEPSHKDTGKSSAQSSTDGFDDFIMGGARSSSKVDGIRTTANKPSSGTNSNGFENADYLDAIFGGSNAGQRKNAPRPSSMAQNSLVDDFFHEEEPNVKQASSRSSFSTKKGSSATNVGNDFTSLFGAKQSKLGSDVSTSSGEFHEIEGEPAERRRARLKRYMQMKARMAEALDEKNQRDLQSQREQEEKRRLAETLDNDIKRWAAGKEGNLRALLSSLQQVLGPECGWRPVSLTDLITSESVKKVYKKATLYVHPDKVQQRGANLQQKYIAEKVFDILKVFLL